jgi:hypothetical protein
VKAVFEVCLLLIKASSPRARSEPAEEKDSRLKVVEDEFGSSKRLTGVRFLSVFLP